MKPFPGGGPITEVLKTVEKAFKLVEMIAEQPMTFTEMMTKAGSNKATLYRFLSTFERLGYVKKNQQEKYHLSQQWFQIALKASSHLDIIQIARPYLESITETVNESSFLAQLSFEQVQYVEKIESKSAARIVVNIGRKAPLYCVASGKLFLAHFDEKQLEDYFARNELKPMTANTITRKQDLLKELVNIRTNGYAVDDEEWEEGLKGISFPIYNARQEMVFALSVSALSYRFSEDIMEQSIKLGLEAVKEISLRLGFTHVT
ncbi:IclR family transcriptional regulator [Neobacillus mesonae]|uniref:IclR family transcriptional regulator n=1 Tax=Neobacillus mesonae TaxID=1193713 RepID=UPI002040F52E|nr:IclR family transcriptional regulator [Neobacillus mesonae]MCM3568502.1 IclR family transcriptional regulator [Neobacillus mesonae]